MDYWELLGRVILRGEKSMAHSGDVLCSGNYEHLRLY